MRILDSRFRGKDGVVGGNDDVKAGLAMWWARFPLSRERRCGGRERRCEGGAGDVVGGKDGVGGEIPAFAGKTKK